DRVDDVVAVRPSRAARLTGRRHCGRTATPHGAPHPSRHPARPASRRAASTRSAPAMSTIQRAYTTELDLNNQQLRACKRHAGAARWAYHWGLARKQTAYKATGTSPSAMELHRELNRLTPSELLWRYQVSTCARRRRCATSTPPSPTA